MTSSAEICAMLCRMGGLSRFLTSALTASLQLRIDHVLKPPGVLNTRVTTFLKPGEQDMLKRADQQEALPTCSFSVDKGIHVSVNGGKLSGGKGRFRLFSRPHVSNNNLYSKPPFRTAKNRPDHPRWLFPSTDDFCDRADLIVYWYKHRHCHRGILFVTSH